jgi:hypothetical protein
MSPGVIRAIANRVGYERAAENKFVADFCLDLGVDEYHFNETLDLVQEFKAAGKRVTDRMPNITIDGATLGLGGHKLSKIPKCHLLNLWIGKVVKCCNTLDDMGKDMARAQFNEADNGLYVITNRHDHPIAKLSGWLSQKGNFVFNAWERKGDEQDFLMTRFVLASAIQILEQNPKMSRVTMGAGPLKIDLLPFKRAADPERSPDNVGRTQDSDNQIVIAEQRSLSAARKLLADQIAISTKRGEVRIKMTREERLNLHGQMQVA